MLGERGSSGRNDDAAPLSSKREGDAARHAQEATSFKRPEKASLFRTVNMKTVLPHFVPLVVTLICINAAIGNAATTIMCLGDSITAGTIAGGYRSRLCTNLTKAGYDFTFVGTNTSSADSVLTTAGQTHHEGHGGYTISHIQDNLDGNDGKDGNNGGYWFAGTSGRAAVFPDIILLQIGTNDVYQESAEATAIGNRLDSLIGHIFVDRPKTTLIVASVTPIRDLTSSTYEETATAYNALIPDLVAKYAAQGRNAYFLDMHSKLTTSDIADAVHPTQAGYNKMGDAWFGAITAVPEPRSVVLLSIGAMGTGCFLRQRRKHQTAPRVFPREDTYAC